MKVLLIQGGWSSERDVSLSSGAQIHTALLQLGHIVTVFDPLHDLRNLLNAASGQDFAFIALHGSPGEDGLLQAMLEQVGCPFQGADTAGSLLAINKAAAKVFYEQAHLPTPRWQLLTSKPERGWVPSLRYPLFIKANTGGSSLHMERVETPEELPETLDRLFAIGDAYIVEEGATGLEATCGILGSLDNGKETPHALDPILIKPRYAHGLFDYKSKYLEGGAEEICPAPFSDSLTKEIQKIALKAHTILGITGYSRSDFIIMENDQPMLLETNTLPGMTQTSLLPKETAVLGMSFADLIDRLIQLGLARHTTKRNDR